MKLQKGFSLIELMIVVAIVGILAVIVVPSYRDYLTRGRIPDATSNLAAKRVQLEQFYQDNRTYINAPACVANSSISEHFNFSCSVQEVDTYTLRAVGKGAMDGFTYTVNEDNAKATTITATGWTGNAGCWVTKKGGAC
jgi:type IV pilus assembly protein PilE